MHCRNLFLGMIGALIGMVIIVFHNYYLTGEMLQSSASIKYYWSLQEGHNPIPFIYQCVKLFVPIPRLGVDLAVRYYIFKILMYIVATILLLIVFFYLPKFLKKEFFRKKDSIVLIINSTIVIVYTLLYSFNSAGMQTWYTGTVIVSIGTLFFFLFRLLSIKYQWIRYVALIGIFTNISVCWFSKPFYSGQSLSKVKGQYVASQLAGENVGAWDAGIMGFYSGGRIINLDGIVNSEVIPYIKGDSLPKYIFMKKICYLLQSPQNKGLYYGIPKTAGEWFEEKEIFFNGEKFNIVFVKYLEGNSKNR